MSLTPAELARYQRHLSLSEIGAAGQEQLKAAKMLLVGAGGLGSPAALYLAAGGIGNLGIIDHDRVDASNLQRQVLFATADIGALKADTARARLLALNPDIKVVSYPHKLTASNALELLRPYDIIIDGSDRLATRYLVNDACVLLGKPLVSAAIHRFEGQAMTYVPGAGPCYRCLFGAADDGAVPNCAEAGVLGVLPGVMGTLQATEAIKLILGIGELLVGRLLTYDALAMRFDEFRFARRHDCAVCGDQPTIRTLRDGEPATQRLSPRELQSLIDAAAGAHPRSSSEPGAPATLCLIDVRQPEEFAVAHLPNALNLPLTHLPQRLADIPSAAHVVFICRSGGRSQAACRTAAAAGLRGAADLEGGLLAWCSEVDTSFTVAPPPN